MSGLGTEASARAEAKGGLTVSTLLMLVAAIGLGLAVTRTLPDFLFLHEDRALVFQFSVNKIGGASWGAYSLGLTDNNFGRFPRLSSRNRASYWLDHVVYWSSPCLASLTFAAMLLGMRRPGPPRRASRRPGRVVGLAVLLALAVKLVECVSLLVAGWYSTTPAMRASWKNVDSYWGYFWLTLPGPAALGVVVGWLALALVGRRPAAPDSAEWLGRAIGWCWIALAASRALVGPCLALGH